MHRATRALILGTFLVTWLGCSAEPETAETMQALSGVSQPPPGGWVNQPWLCSPQSWNPIDAASHPWPQHGWCAWQPQAWEAPSGPFPWRVTSCQSSTLPFRGVLEIHDDSDLAGHCAWLYGDPSWQAPSNTLGYYFDSDLVQENGWLSVASGVWTTIRSMKVAPYTNVDLCEGPLTGPSGAPCNAYSSFSVSTGPTEVAYDTIIKGNGALMTVAAIVLGYTP